MSIINRNNYEIYFLDYLEGNLTPEIMQEMELFLINNPDLKDELDGLEDAVLPDDKIIFQAKQLLKNLSLTKRPEQFITDDEFLIAKIEGDLTQQEEIVFESYLKGNLSIIKEYSLLLLTKLQADQSIVFENKSILYKQKKTSAFTITNRPVRYVTDDEFLVAKIEGDLTPDEEIVFESYVNGNSTREKEYSLYKLAKLKPDKSIVFNHKSTLKRLEMKPINYFLRKYSLSVASVAAIFLFIVLFVFDKDESPITPNNSNYLSLIHRSSESHENIISENKISFSGNPEKKSIEKNVVEFEIKVQKNLHNEANQENSNNIKTINEKPLIKTELSLNNKVTIDENFNPDNLPDNLIQNQIIINKVPTPINQIVKTNFDESNQPNSNLSPKKNVKSENRNFTFWDLAVMGVRGLSNLSGKKIELKRQYDADGNVKTLAFNSSKLEISAPVKKR